MFISNQHFLVHPFSAFELKRSFPGEWMLPPAWYVEPLNRTLLLDLFLRVAALQICDVLPDEFKLNFRR